MKGLQLEFYFVLKKFYWINANLYLIFDVVKITTIIRDISLASLISQGWEID